MKKLNNKGFAIASILYSIMVLFLLLLLSILGILGNRKAILDKNKKDILEELNKEVLYNKINFEHKNITIINRGNLDDIRFALLDGVSAVDENGNEIGLDKINYNLDLNNIENKLYNVTYTVDRGNKIITATRQISFVPDSSDYIDNFDYTGDSQTFTTKYNGSYRVELWGAQGGGDYGGKGAYTKGNILLNKYDDMYIFVGGRGTGGLTTQNYDGGYNGGGNITSVYDSSLAQIFEWYSYTGGGATDIRINDGTWNNYNLLSSRIMVASGGGGMSEQTGYPIAAGGYGGTIIGGSGETSYYSTNSYGLGGTQVSGGQNKFNDQNFGGFGIGGDISNAIVIGTGGGGYYGGGSAYEKINQYGLSSGGGGSSFISGYDGCDAISEESTEDNIIHTGQSIHYSGYKFSNAVMYAGNEEMPTHDGNGTMVGNSGNGFARILLIYYY